MASGLRAARQARRMPGQQALLWAVVRAGVLSPRRAVPLAYGSAGLRRMRKSEADSAGLGPHRPDIGVICELCRLVVRCNLKLCFVGFIIEPQPESNE